MPTIVLAARHAPTRRQLRTLLETEPAFVVVGEAADGPGAIDLVEALQPAVLIVDLRLARLNGLEIAWRVSQQFPHIKIILLSRYPHEAYVQEALRNGASGYVLKQSLASELIPAVQAAVAGQRSASPPSSR